MSGPVLKHNSGLDGRPCYLRPGERRNRQTLACNNLAEYAKMYQVKKHVQKHAFFLTISDLQIGVRVRTTTSTSFPFWACAVGLKGKIFRSARAQNLKLVLVAVLARTPIWRSLLTRDSKTYGSNGWLSSVSGSWMRNISPQKDDWLTKHGWSTEQKQSLVYKQTKFTNKV